MRNTNKAKRKDFLVQKWNIIGTKTIIFMHVYLSVFNSKATSKYQLLFIANSFVHPHIYMYIFV